MSSQIKWNNNLSIVASQLYRSFGYASVHDRADALHGAILRLLSLQQTSGLSLEDEDAQRWLHCVATRMLLDARRTSVRTRIFSDVILLEPPNEEQTSFDPPDNTLPRGAEIGLDISAALLHLSPSLRCSFELHTQGFRAEEIAAMLCITREAVHKRVQRARREMQIFLKDYL